MLALTLAAAVFIGLALGVLGGGSILTVPILVHLAGLDAKQAIATSLFAIGVTSAAGAIIHARTGRVRWRTGLIFGTAGMAVTAAAITGSLAGGRLAGRIPEQLLCKGFGWLGIVMGGFVLAQQLPAGV
ncbi:TSUP family transporter [Carbonactinospora thermoautotrophica]|uniref:TSUP family transporter n=1 Tax=Carbonactinospora thermoautotrophica TaxID=1469144 RepID=UPI00082CFD96